MNCCFPCFPSSTSSENLPLISKDAALKNIFKNRNYAAECSEKHSEEQNYQLVFPDEPHFWAHHCVDQRLILSEAPKEATLNAFFKMVHEKADCIIMLMQSEEYGHLEYAKPVRYLECDESKMDYSVSRTYKSRSEFIEGSILEIKLKGSDQPPKKVPHFHYAMWVEGMKGNPDHIATLARNAMKAKKPVIHCWTGNGRAAVVAAVIASYENIIKGDRSPDVIKNAITALQKERPGAVSEPSQRRAVYEATKALLIEDRLLKK